MANLSENDVNKVKKALKIKKATKPKTKKKAKAVTEEPVLETSPVVRRRSKKPKETTPVVEASSDEEVKPKSGVRIIRRKRKDASPEKVVAESATPAPAAVPVEETSDVSTKTTPEVVAKTPVSTPDTSSDAVKVASPDSSEPKTSDKDVSAHPKTPKVEAPKKPSSKPRNPRGARVLGRIDLGTIQDRMDTKRFSSSPDNSSRRGGGGGGGARGKRPAGAQSGTTQQNTSTGTTTAGASAGPGRRKRGGNRSVRDHNSIYNKGRGRGRNNRKNKRKQKSKKTEITVAAEHKRVVRIEDTITVGELGREMGVKAGMLALKLMELGMTANVNTTLDLDTASLVAEQFSHTVENVAFDISNFYDTGADSEDTLKSRPPIVTIMGHVDHGKTSLLDAIRSTSVTGSEAGGITQHIGAYTVEVGGGQITFLDTPGHEAFTALRMRGAQITDIVVLVVAADDGVMPQTVEAINHSRSAGVPIIVAVNKIDKVSANPDRVKKALVEYDLVPEAWGGQTLFVDVSALQHLNIDELMDTILLQAEVQELQARPDRDAQGVVVESRLDKGRGPLASVLVQRGTLDVGDIVVIGEHYGRVRAMMDHHGTTIGAAGPSVPAEITGLSGVPDAGEPFFVVQDEKDAKRITSYVAQQNRKKHMAELATSNMDALKQMLTRTAGEHKKLKTIIKADVQGSIEALRHAFSKIGNEEVSVDVIHSAVGGVTENDVNLAASASDEAVVIIAFNVRPDNRATEVAEKYGIEIMNFSIIYNAIDSINLLLEGLLSPVEHEKVIGTAEVRETFNAPKIGTVAGLYVIDGLLRRNAKARLVRDGRIIYDSTLASLRRFKDDVREVQKGFECGASIHNYNDIKVGDVIEVYEVEEVAATF